VILEDLRIELNRQRFPTELLDTENLSARTRSLDNESEESFGSPVGTNRIMRDSFKSLLSNDHDMELSFELDQRPCPEKINTVSLADTGNLSLDPRI
jgi:hypothetical protein